MLDSIVLKGYPNVALFQEDLLYMLRNLGFSLATTEFLSNKITFNPAQDSIYA